MDLLFYLLALGLVRVLQALPLRWAARLGRAGGGLAYWLDARHRHVAIENLTRCFGSEKSNHEIRALARENFKRIGESYSSAIKTASMTWPQLEPQLEFSGLEKLRREHESGGASKLGSPSTPICRVMAVGHFGNFEIYARANHLFPELQFATTYRALKQPALDRLLLDLRSRS